MKKIVFATNNQHKLSEIRSILGHDYEVVSLQDIGCTADIPETGQTLEENALQKAQYVYDHYHISCFADDTGLEVDALGGAPGVYSARYAGEGHDSEANMRKLLEQLNGNDNRKARFRTVIALILKKDVCPCGCTSIKEIHRFEGTVEGDIISEKRGSEGFGYDPIFRPEGYDETFAELGTEVKNTISHRAKATRRLADFLRSLCLLAAVLLCTTVGAQVGTWRAYMAYSEVQQIVKAGNDLFVRASNGLYQYNLDDHSITTYDKVTGLNDTYIELIAWCPEAERLIVAYDNSNIDILDRQGNVVNLSSILQKSMTQEKNINHILIDGRYAYISTGFGVVKIDVKRTEIIETYKTSYNALESAIKDGKIYVHLHHIYSGSVPDELPYGMNIAGSWTSVSDNKIIYYYYVNGYIEAELTSNLLDADSWSLSTNPPTSIFAADNSDYDEYHELVETLNPGGPQYNYFGFMRFKHDRLYTCGGGYNALNEMYLPGTIQVLKDGEWTFMQNDLEEITGWRYRDVLSVDADPQDPDHIFAGGQTGLYEFKNTSFVMAHNLDNSPLESAIEDRKHWVLIEGLTIDDDGNLWVLNSGVPTQSLLEFTYDRQWKSYQESAFMYDETVSLHGMQAPFIDSRGLLWFVNYHYFTASIHCFDTKSHTVVNSFYTLTNQDGSAFGPEYYPKCVCEDREGNIWVGTSFGPVVIEKQNIYEKGTYVTQVKVPRNDGTNYADYLLNNVEITCMAVDGAGRKWFGTKDTGAYLISADNMTQVAHFTTENSKLLSDDIESIAINNKTGEVFFGTSKGLCSYISDATEASDDGGTTGDVYAYPNPVTPDYTGLITVVGLSYNSDVKILSASGKLVAQGRSNGGTFTWDGCDTSGRRVASGVYFVATATSDAKKGVVTKIAIIR